MTYLHSAVLDGARESAFRERHPYPWLALANGLTIEDFARCETVYPTWGVFDAWSASSAPMGSRAMTAISSTIVRSSRYWTRAVRSSRSSKDPRTKPSSVVCSDGVRPRLLSWRWGGTTPSADAPCPSTAMHGTRSQRTSSISMTRTIGRKTAAARSEFSTMAAAARRTRRRGSRI